MTEKDYSGATTSKIGKNAKTNANPSKPITNIVKKDKEIKQSEKDNADVSTNKEIIENYRKAGQISKQVKEYAKSIIKKDVLLTEIAEKIEAKIIELGAEVAFPINLGIDDVAAHYTPILNDDRKASGLLKVDIGVSMEGYVSDFAFSLDLTPEKKHTKLIEASELALKKAVEEIKNKKERSTLSEIGKAIQKATESYGFSPVRNLSGHGLERYEVHSGLTIPNYESKSEKELGEGAFAIEPFATAGNGIVYDGAGGNIFHITRSGQVRDSFARQVLEFILNEKNTLPFSKREIQKKFGTRGLLALKNLEQAGIINEFSQLVEESHSPISQAEISLIIFDGKVEVLGE
jgi:methionyl aminopeptidase